MVENYYGYIEVPMDSEQLARFYESGKQKTIRIFKNRNPAVGGAGGQYRGDLAAGNKHVGGNKYPVEEHAAAADQHRLQSSSHPFPERFLCYFNKQISFRKCL